jgi:flagellar hook protein FlgE
MTFADSTSGLSIEFDFSEGVTPFSNGDRSDLTVAQNGRDGRDRGDLVNVSVNEKGQISLTYSNQDTKTVGDIALALPADAQQLSEIGNGLYELDDLRGIAFAGSSAKGAGRVLSNRLEASNVDLSRQFGELILIQRGYQASSQIVSASNEMIQQLLALRGQG